MTQVPWYSCGSELAIEMADIARRIVEAMEATDKSSTDNSELFEGQLAEEIRRAVSRMMPPLRAGEKDFLEGRRQALSLLLACMARIAVATSQRSLEDVLPALEVNKITFERASLNLKPD